MKNDRKPHWKIVKNVIKIPVLTGECGHFGTSTYLGVQDESMMVTAPVTTLLINTVIQVHLSGKRLNSLAFLLFLDHRSRAADKNRSSFLLSRPKFDRCRQKPTRVPHFEPIISIKRQNVKHAVLPYVQRDQKWSTRGCAFCKRDITFCSAFWAANVAQNFDAAQDFLIFGVFRRNFL